MRSKVWGSRDGAQLLRFGEPGAGYTKTDEGPNKDHIREQRGAHEVGKTNMRKRPLKEDSSL